MFCSSVGGSESGFNSDASQAAQGHCQFYMHEARSRTEMAICESLTNQMYTFSKL